jgi:hypothetical protein
VFAGIRSEAVEAQPAVRLRTRRTTRGVRFMAGEVTRGEGAGQVAARRAWRSASRRRHALVRHAAEQ